VNLFSFQEELTCPERIMIVAVTFLVRGDVHVVHIHFSFENTGIGILQIGRTAPDRLDFRSFQFYPRFNRLFYLIIVIWLHVLNLYRNAIYLTLSFLSACCCPLSKLSTNLQVWFWL